MTILTMVPISLAYRFLFNRYARNFQYTGSFGLKVKRILIVAK